jgi:hypothetical protein
VTRDMVVPLVTGRPSAGALLAPLPTPEAFSPSVSEPSRSPRRASARFTGRSSLSGRCGAECGRVLLHDHEKLGAAKYHAKCRILCPTGRCEVPSGIPHDGDPGEPRQDREPETELRRHHHPEDTESDGNRQAPPRRLGGFPLSRGRVGMMRKYSCRGPLQRRDREEITIHGDGF